jgi:plasmid stabilization system protein ParE
VSHTVQFSPAARDQLAELEDYLSEAASPAVASRYVDAIIAYCEGLATFPMRGRGRDDILAGLRITNYRRRAVIAFLVDAEAQIVSIVGVYYGGRDFEAILRGAPEDDRPPDLKNR